MKNLRKYLAIVMCFCLCAAFPPAAVHAEPLRYNYKWSFDNGSEFASMFGYCGQNKENSKNPNLTAKFVGSNFGSALQVTYPGYKASAGMEYNGYQMNFRDYPITVGDEQMDFLEYIEQVHTISFWVKTPVTADHGAGKPAADNRVAELTFEADTGRVNDKNEAIHMKFKKRVTLPNTGDWAYLSLPISEFSDGGVDMPTAVRNGDIVKMKVFLLSFPYVGYFGNFKPDTATADDPWIEPFQIDEMLFDRSTEETPAITPPSAGEEDYAADAGLSGIAVDGVPIDGFDSDADVLSVPVPRYFTPEQIAERVTAIVAAPDVAADETHQVKSGATYVLTPPEQVPGMGSLIVRSADRTRSRQFQLEFIPRDDLQILVGQAEGIDFSETPSEGAYQITIPAANEGAEASRTAGALIIVRDVETGAAVSSDFDLLELAPLTESAFALDVSVPSGIQPVVTVYFLDDSLRIIRSAVSTGGDTAAVQTGSAGAVTVGAAVESETGELLISGSAANYDGEVFVVVLKPGENSPADNGALFAASVKTDEAGRFSAAFQAPAGVQGEGAIAVGAGGVVAETMFYRAPATEISAVLSAFSALSPASSDEELTAFYNTHRRTLGALEALFSKLSATQQAHCVRQAVAGGEADVLSEIRARLNNEIVLASVAQDTILELYRDYNNILALDTTPNYFEQYMTQALIETVLENTARTKAQTLEALRARFADLSLACAVNHVKAYGQIAPLLEENRALIGTKLDFARYDALGSRKTEFCQYLALNPITELSDLNARLDAFLSQPKEKPSGGGGGGGGGKSSSTLKLPQTTPSPLAPLPVAEPEDAFSDLAAVPWAKEAIGFLAEKGIVSGRGGGRFEPAGEVTREEFAKLIAGAMELPEAEETVTFSDVDSDAWYAPSVSRAFAAGVILGKPDGCFGTGEAVTRQDIAVMVSRALAAVGRPLPEAVGSFADDVEIAGYARAAVYALSSAGILNGTDEGTFAPNQPATRAEAAKIIYGAYQYAQKR